MDAPLPSEAGFLLQDFRVAVNEAIRAGLQPGVTSRYALTKQVYRDLRTNHPGVYSKHLVSVFEVAAGILKNHRRRMHAGKARRIPFVKRLMMKAENQAYILDRKNGVIDLPVRAGLHVRLSLIVSQYHMKYLKDESLRLGSLTILSDRVIIVFRKQTPKPFVPRSVLILDTNERSLDGVLTGAESTVPVVASFPEVAAIQHRHHERRKMLGKKKAYDRRTSGMLCKREGTREHNRVHSRLHLVADSILSFAENERSAIVLEDLAGTRLKTYKVLNRRLSVWPRRKLHQIIEYKAAWRGIPVMKVDPRYSSRKCPICGRIQDSRMGAVFRCECGWKLDRHINASLNLLQTAISKGLEVAGGLRFNPGAFQHDVMMILYDPEKGARSEPNGTSCSRVVTH